MGLLLMHAPPDPGQFAMSGCRNRSGRGRVYMSTVEPSPEDLGGAPEDSTCRFCGGFISRTAYGVWQDLLGSSQCNWVPEHYSEQHHRPV